jgi:tetratricopeptide (TPR) repeat protein
MVWFGMQCAHSTERRIAGPWVRRVALALALVASVGQVPAQDTHWLDVESRIQYGYFTEDPRALRGLVEPLAANDARDHLKSYYAGLLAYRQAQLVEAQANAGALAAGAGNKLPTPPRKNDRARSEARQMAERCVSSLDHALEAQKDFADALALRSACLDQVADLGSWRTRLGGSRSAGQLRKALQLAPKNPRVLLLDAIGDYEHSKSTDVARSCDKFKSTAAVFETERANVDQVPGWGAAEAYTWLGRCYLGNGDPVPARDALERALLIAPEFGQAKRLLSSITSG